MRVEKDRLIASRYSIMLGMGVAVAGVIWPGTRESFAAPVFIGLLALLVSFLKPWLGMVLLALIAPFEQARELPYFGTVFTSEFLLVSLFPGWLWAIFKNPSWRQPVIPATTWSLPFLVLLLLHLMLEPSSVSLKATLKWMECFGVIILGVHIIRQNYQAKWCFWALTAAAGLNAAFGFSQTWQGLHQWPLLLSYATPYGEVVRASGEYGPNTLAALIILVLPFVMVNWFYQTNRWVKLISWISFFILILGFIPTFSVIGFIGLMVALFSLWLLFKPQLFKYFLFSALGVGLVIVILWSFSNDIFSGSFLRTKLLSLLDRLNYVQVIGWMLPQQPLWGIGPGLYKVQAINWRLLEMNIVGLITHPHSLWLLILIENGILGLGAFIWGIGKLSVFLYRKYQRIKVDVKLGSLDRAAAYAGIAGLIGVGVVNLAEHGLVHDRGVHVAIALVAALVMVKRPASKNEDSSKKRFDQVWLREAANQNWEQALQERSKARQPLYQMIDLALKGHSYPKILELGCGPALDAIHLATNSRNQVTALDYSVQALALAKQAAQALGKQVTFCQADVRHTPLPPASFDVIYSQGLLEHFKEPDAVWKEMIRLLKPDGKLIIDVPQTFNPYTIIKWIHQLSGDWPWGWETQYTLGHLKKYGKKYGLELVAASGYGYQGGSFDITTYFKKIGKRWLPKLWQWLEQANGQYWMMNVVVCFRKKEC